MPAVPDVFAKIKAPSGALRHKERILFVRRYAQVVENHDAISPDSICEVPSNT
jgi:hypothetical protein